ncbi:MAG TPA: 23S rRNA (uracil(1939)-C(5))-methyltransferase RlmD [Chlamydiales bacterium]
MNKPQINQIISLEIHGLGSGGEGVGYFHGYVVFVDGALPGETVEAKMTQCQKRHGWAELISITKRSPDRVEPPCKLFGTCGGCQLMHLSYHKQLEIKRQKVVDALRRIGKLENVPVEPCVASPSSLGYRNKIQLPVRPGNKEMAIGLYARASHELIEVDHCYIHCPLGEQVYQAVRSVLKRSDLVPYDPIQNGGELRHVLIKSAVHTGEVLVILVTDKPVSFALRQVARDIMAANSAIKGVVHNLHQGKENVILGQEYTTLEGTGSIQEKLLGLKFKVSPASFFQVNAPQAEQLYTKALEFAALTGQETVLDAYCGVGTLSLLFAQKAKKVIGVECVPEAIQDAKENREINQIKNTEFFCDDAEKFIQKLKGVDVVLLNPPRKGCEPLFLEGLGRLRPKRVVYISCDPATLARDLAQLVTLGFSLETIAPYDMFPQTSHVEAVAQLNLS